MLIAAVCPTVFDRDIMVFAVASFGEGNLPRPICWRHLRCAPQAVEASDAGLLVAGNSLAVDDAGRRAQPIDWQMRAHDVARFCVQLTIGPLCIQAARSGSASSMIRAR